MYIDMYIKIIQELREGEKKTAGLMFEQTSKGWMDGWIKQTNEQRTRTRNVIRFFSV